MTPTSRRTERGGARARRPWTSRVTPSRCAVSAPGGARCSRKAGHAGWHRHAGMEWVGDAWWLPRETLGVVPALIQKPASKLSKNALKRAALGIGSAVLALGTMGVLLGVERVANAPELDPPAHCVMQPSDGDALHPRHPEHQRTG